MILARIYLGSYKTGLCFTVYSRLKIYYIVVFLSILFNQKVVQATGETGGLHLNKRSTALKLTGEAPVNSTKFKGGSD